MRRLTSRFIVSTSSRTARNSKPLLFMSITDTNSSSDKGRIVATPTGDDFAVSFKSNVSSGSSNKEGVTIQTHRGFVDGNSTSYRPSITRDYNNRTDEVVWENELPTAIENSGVYTITATDVGEGVSLDEGHFILVVDSLS